MKKHYMKNKKYRIHRQEPLNILEYTILKLYMPLISEPSLSRKITMAEGYNAMKGLVYLASLFLEEWNENTKQWETCTKEMLWSASPEDYGVAIDLVLKHLDKTVTDSELQTSTGFRFKF